MVNRSEVITKLVQVRDLQGNKVDVGFHCPCNLLCGEAVLIDVLKKLVVVQKYLRRNDVRLLFRFGAHIIKHKLTKRIVFCEIPVKLIMPQLMSAHNSLHLSG